MVTDQHIIINITICSDEFVYQGLTKCKFAKQK